MCADVEMVYNVTYVDENGEENCIDEMSYEELEELRTKYKCSWYDEDRNEFTG